MPTEPLLDQEGMKSRTSPSAHAAFASATELQSLLARVEAASGPDRELDKALWYKLIFDPEIDKGGDAYLKVVGSPQPWYTASLDAALALVERLGFHAVVNTFHPFANVAKDGFFAAGSMVEAQTVPLSVCAALLKALIAQQAFSATPLVGDKSRDLQND